jgi:hypothetical protein
VGVEPTSHTVLTSRNLTVTISGLTRAVGSVFFRHRLAYRLPADPSSDRLSYLPHYRLDQLRLAKQVVLSHVPYQLCPSPPPVGSSRLCNQLFPYPRQLLIVPIDLGFGGVGDGRETTVKFVIGHTSPSFMISLAIICHASTMSS